MIQMTRLKRSSSTKLLRLVNPLTRPSKELVWIRKRIQWPILRYRFLVRLILLWSLKNSQQQSRVLMWHRPKISRSQPPMLPLAQTLPQMPLPSQIKPNKLMRRPILLLQSPLSRNNRPMLQYFPFRSKRKPQKSSSILKLLLRRKIPNPRCPSARKVCQSSAPLKKTNPKFLRNTTSWIHSVKKPTLSKKS